MSGAPARAGARKTAPEAAASGRRGPLAHAEPRRLPLDIASVALSHVAYKLIGLLVLAALARALPREALGQYFFVSALALLAMPLTELGMNTLLVRDVALEPSIAGARLRQVLAIRVPLAAALVGTTALALRLLRPEVAWLATVTAVSACLDDLYLTFGALFTGLGRFRLNALLGVAGKLAAGALVVWVAYSGAGIAGVVAAMALGDAARCLAAGLVARHVARREGAPAAPRADAQGGGPFSAAREILPRAFPLFALTALGVLHLKADTAMLGWLAPYAVVAGYGAAFRVLEAAQLIVRPAGMVYLPLFTKSFADGAVAAVARSYRRLIAGAALAGLAGAAGVFVFADLLLGRVFGAAYAESAPVLRILYLSLPAFLVSALSGMTARALRIERQALRAVFAGLVLNVAGNAFAIPVWGAIGAAWVTVVTLSAQAALLTAMNLRALAAQLPAPDGGDRTGAGPPAAGVAGDPTRSDPSDQTKVKSDAVSVL